MDLIKYLQSEKKTYLKFLISGGLTTSIDYIIYRLLIYCGIAVVLSKTVSMIVAMSVSYIINSKWSFNEYIDKTTRKNKAPVRFVVCQGINFTTNVSVNYILYSLTGYVNVAYIIATISAMVINFLLQRYWVFGGVRK